jgi:hypothetical protein
MNYLDEVYKQTADGGYFDFTRCQKPNGRIYGTSGSCKSGTEIGAKEEPAAKAGGKFGGVKVGTDKRLMALSVGQLKQLREDPRLYDYQKKKIDEVLAKKSSDTPKTPEAAKSVATTKTEAKPKGLFMKGDDVDIYEVEKKAEAWRKEAGLNATPGTLDWKHDRVHALTHEFLGGSDKVGKWLGNDGKSPTGAEETLVNMVHRTAALKARGDDPRLSDSHLQEYFRRDILFMTGRNNIKDEDMKYYYKENGEPDTEKFVKKYREMEASPGYDKLLDASHSAWSNAGDYVL